MKKAFFILSGLLAGLLLSSCAPKTTAALGEEFTLAIGESAAIKGENLRINFVRVLEDSRCPLGVQCIQAGRARSLVSFTTDYAYEVELIEPGLTDPPNRQIFQKYQIDFRLLPYPEAGKEITDDQYRLTMTVSRAK